MSEYNRYFNAKIPLEAPEEGSILRAQDSAFKEINKEGQHLSEEVLQSVFDGDRKSKLVGERQFSYHVMALMVRKEYGNVQAALEQMIVSDAVTEFEPFVIEKDGEYICLGKLKPPGERGEEEDKSGQSLGEKLSMGKAADEGDVFVWKTTAF
jgi:hypothetical protein